MRIVEPVRIPYTILIDTAESQPFTFHDILADAKQNDAPLIVGWRYSCLGRHPHGLGDYTIEGLGDRVAVERKSMEDAQGTVLGWETPSQRENGGTGRRERFKSELQNLANLDAAMVIVEATFGDCLRAMPEWGKKPASVNRKIFFRSVIAFQQDYRVPWCFCDNRRLAEITTFRFLDRYFRKHKEK